MSGRKRAEGSRRRLITAAGGEFAELGFAGASVDRIAEGAGVNKAMIYYCFADKLDLYRQTIREMYLAVHERVAAVADTGEPAPAKLDAFVAALVTEASRRPYFPRIAMREIADRAVHLDRDTIQAMLAIPGVLERILTEGADRGELRHVDPLLAYFTVLGPIVLHFGTAAALEGHLAEHGVALRFEADSGRLLAHVQSLARAMTSASLTSPVASSRVEVP